MDHNPQKDGFLWIMIHKKMILKNDDRQSQD